VNRQCSRSTVNLARELDVNKRDQTVPFNEGRARECAGCGEVHRVRDAGAGGSNPLSPTTSPLAHEQRSC
jgi:hypothetical protein